MKKKKSQRVVTSSAKAKRAKPAAKKVKSDAFAAAVGRALRKAAKTACKTARMYGTPIYVWQDGKVVALKP